MSGIKCIENNPYRILGVYANAPIKERVSNCSRITTFLKVGKPVTFPTDFPILFQDAERTDASVSAAVSALSLPQEQFKHAQFWFVKLTTFDDIAFRHLTEGNVETAMSIWEQKLDMSSLQNLTILHLIRSDYRQAMGYASKLYMTYCADFVNAVLGGQSNVDTEVAWHDFLDTLCDEVNVTELLDVTVYPAWKQYLSNKAIDPLIDSLENEVKEAEATKGKGITARYKAGQKLASATKRLLDQLRGLLPIDDMRYQMIADKVGLEILACGIDYFNGSDAADSAEKAMKLQSYALSVVVGTEAKEHCQKNVDILKEIIAELPPETIRADMEAITQELKRVSGLSRASIAEAVTLMNNAEPHLAAIKQKVGDTNDMYLKISTAVVNVALGILIERVNEAQESIGSIDHSKHISIRNIVDEAMKATLMMDSFDMSPEFRQKRYLPNRNVLVRLELERLESQFSAVTDSLLAHIDPHIVYSKESWIEKISGYIGCLILVIIFVIIPILAAIFS